MHEYKKINVSQEPKTTVEAAANRWAAMGWHTVAVIPASGPGYADAILVKREKINPGNERREYLIRFLRGCAMAADRGEIGAEMMDELRPLLLNDDLLREAANAFEALNQLLDA